VRGGGFRSWEGKKGECGGGGGNGGGGGGRGLCVEGVGTVGSQALHAP
jgi:hypothetical protein